MQIKNGSEYIGNLISDAIKRGERSAIVKEDCIISEAIRLPSDFTLILDGCRLTQATGCFDNVFVNQHHGSELGRKLEGRDHGIRIIGRAGAVIDGVEYNGLSERNSGQNGMTPIWKNNMILFTNVEDFEISGIRCVNQRWWALNFIYCAHGRLSDIDFCSSDVWIDDEGAVHHGLLAGKYKEILIKNSDGIDIRQGCHHIDIANITGFTEDDTVALTALNGRLEQAFSVEGMPSDIADITVRGVHSSAYCSIVRLLNQGEIALHDVLVEDVYDTSKDSPYMDRAGYAVRIGDAKAMYGDRHATEDETYNITVRHIVSRARRSMHLGGNMKNVTIEDVTTFDGGGDIEDMRE